MVKVNILPLTTHGQVDNMNEWASGTGFGLHYQFELYKSGCVQTVETTVA